MKRLLEPLWRIVFPLFLLGNTVACSKPQAAAPESVGLSAEKLQAIHNILAAEVEAKHIAGAVALVARHGKTAYLDPVGMQDVEAGKPMAADTIFCI